MKYDLVKIAVGRRKIIPHAAHIVEGTEGLLAITKRTKREDWCVTHVATGLSFPLTDTSSRNKCVGYAQRIFEKYPRCRLREKSAAKVIGTWNFKRFLKMMELA